jgi:hypothetical protein
MVAPGLLLRQGLLHRRWSGGEWTHPHSAPDRSLASPPSTSHRVEEESAGRARQMHCNTQTDASSRVAAALKAASPDCCEAVIESRSAGNGLTWAELFMMKRKRLLEPP